MCELCVVCAWSVCDLSVVCLWSVCGLRVSTSRACCSAPPTAASAATTAAAAATVPTVAVHPTAPDRPQPAGPGKAAEDGTATPAPVCLKVPPPPVPVSPPGEPQRVETQLDRKLQLLDSQLRHILKSTRDDSVASSSGGSGRPDRVDGRADVRPESKLAADGPRRAGTPVVNGVVGVPGGVPADSGEEGDDEGAAAEWKPSVTHLLSLCGADESNVYQDDVATRAAPFTIVSQLNASLGDSDSGSECDGDAPSRSVTRAQSLTSLTASPFSDWRRGSGTPLMKQLLDVSEKLGGSAGREFWRRRDDRRTAAASDSSGGHEHKPVMSILDEIPKPKFSTKSPSSPAKLASAVRATALPLAPPFLAAAGGDTPGAATTPVKSAEVMTPGQSADSRTPKVASLVDALSSDTESAPERFAPVVDGGGEGEEGREENGVEAGRDAAPAGEGGKAAAEKETELVEKRPASEEKHVAEGENCDRRCAEDVAVLERQAVDRRTENGGRCTPDITADGGRWEVDRGHVSCLRDAFDSLAATEARGIADGASPRHADCDAGEQAAPSGGPVVDGGSPRKSAATSPRDSPLTSPRKLATESPRISPATSPRRLAAESPHKSPVTSPRKLSAESSRKSPAVSPRKSRRSLFRTSSPPPPPRHKASTTPPPRCKPCTTPPPRCKASTSPPPFARKSVTTGAAAPPFTHKLQREEVGEKALLTLRSEPDLGGRGVSVPPSPGGRGVSVPAADSDSSSLSLKAAHDRHNRRTRSRDARRPTDGGVTRTTASTTDGAQHSPDSVDDGCMKPHPPPGHAPRTAKASTAIRWAHWFLLLCRLKQLYRYGNVGYKGLF